MMAASRCRRNGYETQDLSAWLPSQPMEELIRWRLWNRTGGGLMAELGSHQLDAASIFIAPARGRHSKVKPITVAGDGRPRIFPLDRDVDDHVYCMFEFPAPGYYENEHAKSPIRTRRSSCTYSSINGNGFGGYGEVVSAPREH